MHRNQSFRNYRVYAQDQLFRLNVLMAGLIILSFLLILRLAFLQISQFKRYQTLSLKNQLSLIPIPPPRGVILDRNGLLMAENIPVYSLEMTPERVKKIEKTLEKLRQLIPSITDEDIKQVYRTKAQHRAFIPIPIKLKLTQEEVALFASNQYRFPGLAIKAQLMRHYPLKEVAAHVLGYVGRINVEELKTVDPSNYRATHFIGKSGVEKYYENQLHGNVGYQVVETDVNGRTLRVMSKENPHSGDKLYLSIDIRLQKVAYEALKEKRGALVLMDVHNGEILAMVSTPSFDPNLFVAGVSTKEYKKLSNAIQRPLYNRAVRGLYPPGSTMKPFIGLAGLDKGFITPNTETYCTGKYKLPTASHVFKDWKKTGHGLMNFRRAITVSCDTFFYQLGSRMGISNIAETLRQFGLGQLSQVDLSEEAAGIVPSPHWKRQAKGASWYPGDTVITSIGQGFMLATPLQIANATATLSQHGKGFNPHVLMKTIGSDEDRAMRFQSVEKHPIQLNDESHWERVIEAMHQVLNSNEGTGYKFGRNPPYPVAGKTGTVQVHSGKQYEKTAYTQIPELLRDHSLFIAFTPVKHPEVALAVLVENDPSASMVARQVLDAYYQYYPMKKNDEQTQ